MAAVVAVSIAGLTCAAAASAFDAQQEAANEARGDQREQVWMQPDYQLRLTQESQKNVAAAAAAQAADPERNFAGDACSNGGMACAGDIRLYDWRANGYGLVDKVLWTARNGSTVSGHVWATRAGPRKRPAVIITNGSVQAPEQVYWWAAQSLAKAGYVVVTFDPQQQGLSDTYGEGADRNDGLPSQTEGNTFYDWTQDAIDFLLSKPSAPFCARPSRSGVSHCAKQKRRVAAGLDAAYNPMWRLVEGQRIGLVGHSYGASGVSWMAQQDKRVDAVVALDNLCDPAKQPVPLTNPVGLQTGQLAPLGGPCLKGAQGPPPGYRVPSLGITVDTFAGEPRTSDPDPFAKGQSSRAFSNAGIDSGSLVIRGGTHFDFSYLPMQPFRATLRGIELSAWYTRAWFDKYLKSDPTADRRLLTSRWRTDSEDRRVDPGGGGNVFSFYYRSRLDITRSSGERVDCEDLRTGCPGQVTDDGEPAAFSYEDVARTPDHATKEPAPSLMSVQQAHVVGGWLRVRGSVNPAASGRRVRVILNARGHRLSFTSKLSRRGRFQLRRRLRGKLAKARSGIVTLRLPASRTVRAGTAHLRVADKTTTLRPTVKMVDGRMIISGRITRKATGHVVVTLVYDDDAVRSHHLTRTARIKKGRFALTVAGPYPVRFDGAQVTVTWRGSAKHRLAGRQSSRFIQP